MTKEELVALGLTEEQADAMLGKYGNMIPKERFDEVNNAKKTLEAQVKTHETQLKDLQGKAKDSEELQSEIAKLQEANETAAKEYAQQLQDERMNSAVKLALAGKVHDAGIVSRELDTTKIELDEQGNIKSGLDEQLKTLQEAKSFLFVPEKPADPQQPNFRGFVPPKSDTGPAPPPGEPTTLKGAVASFFAKNTQE